MSYHSMSYLNSGKIIVGNTNKTGNAWWYNQSLENPANPTHYAGFIPLTVVKDRLFGWTAWESNRLVAYFDQPERDDLGNIVLDLTGEPVMKTYEVPVTSFKAIGREDWVVNGVPSDEEDGADAILHVQGKDYGVHQLQETFITTTSQIVQGADNMGIVSAGLLKWGRRAWITISIPDNLTNDESGLQFRPNLTVSTSFDSSLATSWTRTFGIPVCDNTLDYQLAKAGEKDGKFILRHTKNSAMKIKDAVEALGMLNQQADEMDKALAEMVKTEVPEGVFLKWLDRMVPVPDLKEKTIMITSIQGEQVPVKKVSTNGHTMAINKREKLVEMWDFDPRVAPWKNTKLGILQLWNTFNQHERSFKVSKQFDGNRLAAKVESQQLKTLSGDYLKEDVTALQAVDSLLAELVSVPVLTPAGKRTRAKAGSAS